MHFWSLHVHYPSPSPSPAAPTVVVGVGNGNEQQSVVYHPRQLTHRTASSYWEEKKSAFGIEHMLFASFFLFVSFESFVGYINLKFKLAQKLNKNYPFLGNWGCFFKVMREL